MSGAADTVSQLLGEDHRRLDAVLADARRCLAAADVARAADRFAAFRSGLERHIAVEEEVVFPELEALGGAAAHGPTQVMRAEHAELRRLMEEIASLLARGGDPQQATPFAALTARVYAHNGKEERILYPATDRAARASGALAALVERIRQL